MTLDETCGDPSVQSIGYQLTLEIPIVNPNVAHGEGR
jgi:hypothetical protein